MTCSQLSGRVEEHDIFANTLRRQVWKSCC